MFVHNSCSYCYYKDISNLIYVDMHLKTVLAVCLVFRMKCKPPPLHMRKILVLNKTLGRALNLLTALG